MGDGADNIIDQMERGVYHSGYSNEHTPRKDRTMSEDKIFCGNGKQVQDWKLSIYLQLWKIPKDRIKRDGQGRPYVKLEACAYKDGPRGEHGETHYLAVDTWEPQQRNGDRPCDQAHPPPPMPQREERRPPNPASAFERKSDGRDEYDRPNESTDAWDSDEPIDDIPF